MNEGSELSQSNLRAIYYAMWELGNNLDGTEVLQHLCFNVRDYYTVSNQRDMVIAITKYLASKLENLRPAEASYARIVGELVANQRIG
jgi:putative DNA methylase